MSERFHPSGEKTEYWRQKEMDYMLRGDWQQLSWIVCCHQRDRESDTGDISVRKTGNQISHPDHKRYLISLIYITRDGSDTEHITLIIIPNAKWRAGDKGIIQMRANCVNPFHLVYVLTINDNFLLRNSTHALI
ncbi:5583_t:CDS:2 [Acaulospora morrowiae]|uniref:5583_t:CDS:1 n=1 Tax=Acaulospora morrowiae TaxID=94023 RepID=A0A9N8YV54_9GLOM|nr:5583_t:CDS:2 [Acaulospora morrowiae]